MDVEAFAAELPRRFDGDANAEHPVDRRLAAVVERVPGMTTEHALTVLDLAVAGLGETECYLEVGSYRGRSVVGAMLDHPGRQAVAIESFAEFGVDPVQARIAVENTLREFGVDDRVRLVVGDAFRRLDRSSVPAPVGVYFYDGAHSRVAQYLGLALAEPLFAERSLVLVDDWSWPQVRSATRAYLKRHPGYHVVAEMTVSTDFDPRWCNGLVVLAWQRPPDWVVPSGWEVVWRRWAHLGLLAPLRSLAYRVLVRHPRVTRLVAKIYLHGGTRVPTHAPDDVLG
ncbi:MAG TPA: class I SAM-dependent methyltransferase [Actinomycetes bacterium]|nr:class I SAM-dependent methyltransferase [Actinomycetes bacterium]